MKKERKRLNRRVLAFVLVLAMVFSQYTGVFAGEISGNVTVSAPVQDAAAAPVTDGTVAAGDVTAANDGTQTGTEEGTGTDDGTLAADDTKTDEQDVQPGNDQGSPVPEAPAGNENTDPEQTEKEEASENTAGTVSDDKAEKSASENGPEAQTETETETGETADTRISLSGGTISISINGTSEIVSYDGIDDRSLSHNLAEYTKEIKQKIKVDFDVLSSNGGSDSTILKKGTDYDVEYYYGAVSSDWESWEKKDEDFVLTDAGLISVNIIGKGSYKNTIYLNVFAESVSRELDNDSVSINAKTNGVIVNNNIDVALYMAVVSQDMLTSNDSVLYADGVGAGGSRTFTEYYSAQDHETHPMVISTDYVLAVSTDFIFEVSDNAVKKYKFKTVSSQAVPDDVKAGFEKAKDGYSEIKFKAVVDKAKQVIKLSWSPAGSLKYSAYELQRYDGSKFVKVDGYTRGKSFTYKTVEKEPKTPAVFKLICNNTDEYITVAAPALLYTEPSYDTNAMEYCFSELKSDSCLSYSLEIAEKNSESSFTSDKATEYKSTDTEYSRIENYMVNAQKKLSVNALREDYVEKSGSLEIGKTYYCRVRTKYKTGNKTFTSAPSNVIGRKYGPSKSYVIDVTGVKYNKPSGRNKESIEAQNEARLKKYITEWMDDDGTSSFNGIEFVHNDNRDPDAKSGYIIFIADPGDYKAFDLMYSDSQYGTYRKVKTVQLNRDGGVKSYSGLYELTSSLSKDDIGDLRVFAMQYNKFIPEKTQYFAVRAVARTGNALGGFGDGYEVRPELDKVDSLIALDGAIDKINLYWKHDECVKQYWIYKKPLDYKKIEDVPDNILDITSLDGFTLIKKVSGRKSGTLKESDGAEGKTGDKKQLYDLTSGNFVGDYNKYVDKDSKNNEVVTGKIYMYVVIPKYDIKNTDVNYNFDKRSDTDLGMATLASVSVKNFTAANAGVNGYEGKIRVKWNKLKGADKGYVVYRTEVLPADPKTVDAWEALYKANQAKKYTYGQTDGATIAFTDTNVVTGEWYWYCIVATNGGQFDLSTSTKPVYKRAKAVPFAATSVKVEDNDNNIRQGARVTVAADSRNSNVRYYIEKRTNGGNWEYAGGYLTTSGTWTDNSELTRGDKRQYRVVSKVGDYSTGIQGGIREGGYYSKPKSISVKNMPATLALGETANVIVYPMLNENEVATYKRMESSYSGGIEIVSSKSEGDHMVFVIRARAKGKGIFTVWAKGCDWYPNTSRSNLQKSFSVTVK